MKGPMSHSGGSERRVHPRAILAASAILFLREERMGPYLVENLSAGGALLSDGPMLSMGETVKVVLQLPGRRPVNVIGRVVRVEKRREGESSFAVAFRHSNTTTEEAIHRAVLQWLERVHSAREPRVLVLDPSIRTRHALERDLLALGRLALPAGNLLDAMRWLQDEKLEIQVVLVDDSPGFHDGSQFLVFVAEHHSGIRRVVMSENATPGQLPLSDHASFVLPKPWDTLQLADAVRVEST
ncbi:MAG: PilZ domain-containing protein [Pseudomonadota bacterium]